MNPNWIQCTSVVSRAFMAGAASHAGDADSSRAPGLASGLQGSVNVHRGTLLLVPQWQCISSFVFYINVYYIEENSCYPKYPPCRGVGERLTRKNGREWSWLYDSIKLVLYCRTTRLTPPIFECKALPTPGQSGYLGKQLPLNPVPATPYHSFTQSLTMERQININSINKRALQ